MTAEPTGTGRARVGVVVSHPIQYFSPLFDLMAERRVIDLRVRYGNDAGLRAQWDPGFRVKHRWDLDLVSGHDHEFAIRGAEPSVTQVGRSVVGTLRFVRSRDVLVIHGYVTVVSVVAIVCCWMLRKPYWLRSDSSVRRPHHRLSPGELWPRLVYRWSAGALAVGGRNAAVAASLGARSTPVAPFAIDNERFRDARPEMSPPDAAPTVVFAGKFVAAKRPGDVVAAARQMPDVQFTMVGEGELGDELRARASDLPNVRFAGFVNQTAMPEVLGHADVLVLPSSYEPWGLVVNEAMATGAVPVVSDAVGCAPDLVQGLGEVYATGDPVALQVALRRALATARSEDGTALLWARVERFSMTACARVYESVLSGSSDPSHVG